MKYLAWGWLILALSVSIFFLGWPVLYVLAALVAVIVTFWAIMELSE